jgi:7-carboxy-7-deazaguanine synthase
MNAKITEIFRSIQGEGKYAGVSQVFVRFFGCNMHCVWCDTPASIGDTASRYEEFSLTQVTRQVRKIFPGCHSVSITGGEPLEQAEFLKGFCRDLQWQKKTVYLDTNGTLPNALEGLINDIDIIAMDIKLPSSSREGEFWKEHQEFLKIAARKEVFIKTVVSKETLEEDIIKAAKLVSKVDPRILFILQPNHFQIKNGLVKKCVGWQKSCAKILKDVRILPQMHKFLKLR